jgi:hypothetical protein
MNSHIETPMHQANKQGKAIAHFRDIEAMLSRDGLPAGANVVPSKDAAWRFRVVQQVIANGLPISTIDVFAPLFNEYAAIVGAPQTLNLVARTHLYPYIDSVAQRLCSLSFNVLHRFHTVLAQRPMLH